MNLAWLWVGLGGALGSMARFGVSQALPWTPGRWPTATFAVNLLGCLLIGFMWGLGQKTEMVTPAARQFLMVGVLGGFTTFSTFSLESLQMLRQGAYGTAMSYVLLSCVIGLGMVALGAKIADWAV